ncbi:hypothetical protein BJ742DRAFT_817655 [Cladochytrium replicatum]|nr:hypothetical protein BJ742DRAFT_817655 [Cladochytrium replicatum]
MLSIAIKTLILFCPALSLHRAIFCRSFLGFSRFSSGVMPFSAPMSPVCHISDSRLSLEQAQRSSTQSTSRPCVA